ncbi:NAD(P)/FAD-dependent oxidoreductase, partial [Planctomycetota bacterium]
AELGLKTEAEKDGCVFPVSRRAGDVRDSLVKHAKKLGVNFLYGRPVESIEKKSSNFIVKTCGKQILSQKVIIATGGLSWPKTGSTGDGYRFARRLDHEIIEPRPSLVPLVSHEKWPSQIAGTALDNVSIATVINKKTITTTGNLVFTQDGIGGSAAQDMSRYLTDYLPAKTPIDIVIDLKPNLEQSELDRKLTEIISANPKKKSINLLSDFLPRRLCAILYKQVNSNAELPAGQLRKEIRKRLVESIKKLRLSIIRTRPIAEATVTRGGLDITRIEPQTMESLICPGLYFAGEILDVDGPCGGYSLQICFSTGALAGSSAANKK